MISESKTNEAKRFLLVTSKLALAAICSNSFWICSKSVSTGGRVLVWNPVINVLKILGLTFGKPFASIKL